MGEKTQSVWWNDEIKAAVRRKEAAWKVMLAASNEDPKEKCKEEKTKVKMCIY